MSLRIVIVSFCLLIALSYSQAQETKIQHTTAPTTSAASGKQMFQAYCASCHGADAKGSGPAASALKTAPADLTTLSKKNGGKFPSDRVASVLRGQATLAAHGNQEMPVWGPVFWHMSQGHEAEVQQRIGNITKYIESLQEK